MPCKNTIPTDINQCYLIIYRDQTVEVSSVR